MSSSSEDGRKLNLTLKVWRQESRDAPGRMESYDAHAIPEDASFLEMLDIVNARIIEAEGDPIAFDHDCREGICGSCALMINGVAHGPERAVTVCQLHMRHFHDGETIYVEPWRAKPFPVIKDLSTERRSFDRIIEAGGYVSVRTGSAPEANSIPISKDHADNAFDAAACIGCGACVAACPNASAMLFVAAKTGHLNSLPQGEPEKHRRTLAMVDAMDDQEFGNCTNHYECSAVCPKEISAKWIAKLNRDYHAASLAQSFARGGPKQSYSK